MRSYIFFYGCLAVMVLSANVLESVSAGIHTKDQKKKLLEKLRSALSASDAETAAAFLSSVEELETPPAEEIVDIVKVGEEDSSPVEEISDVFDDHVFHEEETTDVVQATPNRYLTQFRVILKRILNLLGLRKEKRVDGRKHRMMAFEANDLDAVPIYRDEIRTTVGAVLGERQCIQKAACGAGSYLKDVKGKNLIFAVVETFSPSSWKDAVKMIKHAAVHDDNCNYKCLE